MPDAPTFFVATPDAAFSASDLDETIRSVVAQKGAFHVVYLINQAEASADVRALLADWVTRIESGAVKTSCLGLTVTLSEQVGIGRGDIFGRLFLSVPFSRNAIMTGLACGNALAPSSLAAVAAVMAAMPEIDLVRGLSSAFDDQGDLLPPDRGGLYDTWLAIGGASDSAAHQPILRGGMFWRSVIWHRLGGMDPALSHACDLDFCSKATASFQSAGIEALLTLEKPKRLGSDDVARRRAEVIAVQQRASLRQKRIVGRLFDRDDPHRLTGIRRSLRAAYDSEQRQWTVADASQVMDMFGLVDIVSGFLDVEGPYPHEELYSPFRWTCEPMARLSVIAAAPKQQISIRLRNPSVNQTISLLLNGELVFQKHLRHAALTKIEEISMTRTFKRGRNDLVLAVEAMQVNEAGVSVGVIVESVEVVAIDP